MPHYIIYDESTGELRGSTASADQVPDAADLSARGLAVKQLQGNLPAGREWNAQSLTWGPPPAPAQSRAERAKAKWAVAVSDTAKLDAIATALGLDE